jgi:F-type H+-transporting ATPase subunit epsilon
MKLKILLPFRVFLEEEDVTRLVVETAHGSLGIWPNRLDCVAALVPGILSFTTDADSEVLVAVDEGLIVKAAGEVMISVRNAVSGADLGKLQQVIRDEFLRFDEQEMGTKSVLAKMESGFIRQLSEFHRE